MFVVLFICAMNEILSLENSSRDTVQKPVSNFNSIIYMSAMRVVATCCVENDATGGHMVYNMAMHRACISFLKCRTSGPAFSLCAW